MVIWVSSWSSWSSKRTLCCTRVGSTIMGKVSVLGWKVLDCWKKTQCCKIYKSTKKEN